MLSNLTKLFLALTLATFSYNSFAKPQNLQEKASYAIAIEIVTNLLNQGLELDKKAFLAGADDVLNQRTPLLTPEEMQAALGELQQKISAERAQKMQQVAQANAKKSADFLKANSKKSGVKTLASGLQYKELKAGTGATPKEDSLVVAHYAGRLIDGTEFDSSYARGEPMEFPLNNVILGWQEALKLMKAGTKWEVYIPAELAYGEQGAGGVIGPNETLIFEIELLEVKN